MQRCSFPRVLSEKNLRIFTKQPEGCENTPPQTNDALTRCGNALPLPVPASQHPGGGETPWMLHFPSKGTGGGRLQQVPMSQGKRPEGTEKGASNTNLKEESEREVGAPFSGAQVADDRAGCHQFGRGFPAGLVPLNLPSALRLLRRHNLMHKRYFFCAVPAMEQVLDLVHGKEERGRYPDMGNECPRDAVGWLGEGDTPYGPCTLG